MNSRRQGEAEEPEEDEPEAVAEGKADKPEETQPKKRSRRQSLDIHEEVLPKSAAARAVRYSLSQWEALTRFLEDGDLEIDNGATERANRGIAPGRGNWTFFGSDNGGRTAAVLMSFIATCRRNGVEPFAWFNDVLSRIAAHPVNHRRITAPQLEAASFTR